MKILFLTSRVPYELDKGDKLRAFHHIKHLSQRHEIILFSLSDEPIPAEAKSALEVYCVEVVFYPIAHNKALNGMAVALPGNLPMQAAYYYNKGAQQKLDKLVKQQQPDHIFCQLVRMAKYVEKYTHIPKTLDYMDALSKGMERRIKTAPFYQRPFFVLESRRLRKFESELFDWFNNKTIISEQDRYFIEHTHKYTIQVVPNGVDTQFFIPDKRETHFQILFAGNMRYAPNIAAAVFLVKKVMPLVWPYFKEAKVLIAGKNPAPEVKALASYKVQVLADLADMREAYNDAQIFVAPLFLGSGLQNKILEAMAMGLPCVTTSQVNNAIGAKKVEQVLIAETQQGFAAHILYLLHHPDEAEALGLSGQKLVQTQYDWETVTSRLEALINPVV
ncbi:glycosyltransferase [Adhaeribacter aquaticus]|uniref:glycosyltransferase n=1 Tax=Adhaeribacter aquaticus TaxID=299567 RepID=UPI0003FDB1E2|nr:glycosyltransferase [Adhaeribacter aquaticus]